MRLYHYLPARHAIDDLESSHLKIAMIDELNDPFELWGAGQSDKGLRTKIRDWKSQMASEFGLLCFSDSWRISLMWSHYADRHRGICLGFDVTEDSVKQVRYVESRTKLELPFSDETAQHLLFTKFAGWSYEKEWRSYFRLSDKDKASGHFFFSFSPALQLREVIVGPLCTETKGTIDKCLSEYPRKIYVVKARLAYKSFRVVEDKAGFAM